MGDIVKIKELKCPGCGSTLKMPAGNAKTVQCEYCGNEYIIDSGQEANQGHTGTRRIPEWEALPPENPPSSASPRESVKSVLVCVVCILLIGLFIYWQVKDRVQDGEAAQRDARQASLEAWSTYAVDDADPAEDEAALSGMLEQMVTVAFGKDAGSVTEQELARIRWIADKRDIDHTYIGYGFENPLENPDAELEWLTFPSGTESGYSSLYLFKGLVKLDTKEALSQCGLQGLSLESLTIPYGTLEETAQALDDPSAVRQLVISSPVESLQGLELFPNLERLTIDAGKLSDADAVAALKQLKSLTLEDADGISDFSVLVSMENLEELSIESENLKSLDFLKRMPWLKGLSLADGKLLSLDGIEALEGLERLSVTECRDLKNMDSVAALTGLQELELEKPYDCEEPSLEGLTALKSLTLKNFSSCAFLSGLTELETLTLRSCDLPENLDLSGLTQLKKLTCTTSYQDRSLAFIEAVSSLESVNLSGMVTYEDISGIFALPHIKELKLSGIECEIDFDRISDNTSLESLEMAGVKLYENVRVTGSGGFVNVYWDDVFLTDHLDFFGHFPNLRKLDVADNEIQDLSFAEGLVNLEEIDFSDNYVTDMHILSSLPALRLVNCTGNPIGNLRVLDDAHVLIINE
ncbi:MAG: leucine-rich repeat domain-containing protein [Lachnospiraceae bacterium]|nr:leucine-rich repeat domain-containing protein [Lachnospiraceae bacterium]